MQSCRYDYKLEVIKLGCIVDVLLHAHVYIAEAMPLVIFCLHLRAPQLIGPDLAALFNGSE
ncbi:hypothetical protein J3F84DRAFT_356657 [Trichoderma pleuroticola]